MGVSMKRMLFGLFAAFAWTAAHAAAFEARAPTPAPALAAVDLAGVSRTLAEYRGKVVLLNFWASWCPPCLREMPSLERLRVKMAGRPLAIVALDSAETADEVSAYLARMQLGFPILLDPDGSNTRRWKVFALPSSPPRPPPSPGHAQIPSKFAGFAGMVLLDQAAFSLAMARRERAK